MITTGRRSGAGIIHYDSPNSVVEGKLTLNCKLAVFPVTTHFLVETKAPIHSNLQD